MIETLKKDTALLLKEEVNVPVKGVYCRNYYMGRGYKKALNAPVSIARATAFAELITETKKHIYKNDIIAGSLRGIFEELSCPDEEIKYYERFVNIFGERGWLQGRDHYASDYEKLVTLGICRIMEEIASSVQTLDKSDRDYKKEHAPESFREALQLVWFAHICYLYQGLYAMALGRIDQYLYPFFKNDIEKGIITEAEGQLMLENVFMKIGEYRTLYGGDDVCNICIGGVTKSGGNAVNELTYAVLYAVGNCNIPGPNLSARIGEKTPDRFLCESLKVIGTGLGYPALMNNDIHVKALKRMGYAEEDCNDFCMVGCIENFIPGKQPPWSDGRFDVPKYLEYTLNRGRCILTNSLNGIDTGDPCEFKSMDEFMQAYEKQIANAASEYVSQIFAENSRYNNANYTNPFMSCLSSGCIEKGLDICDGGSVYPSAHGAGCMGIATVADSLAAIEKVVYTDKAVDMKTLLEALKADFEGYDKIHTLLLAAPKYGNNDELCDKYAVWYVNYLAKLFDSYKMPDGGHFYIAIASNTQNISAGNACAATADGRRAHAPLSDAASPTYGMDRNGPTATVQSLIKPDYTKVACGTVVNQKFSPVMFKGDENISKLASLIRVYFNNGGQEMQINAVSRSILTDAMNNPEKYASLVVRVSGFSAYYTKLDRSIQKDILNRTEHFN
ncbi:MAG: pyruvate formate-lyase [Clostridia bacterium]|nr:pyruvate formate-lyase [Clostridia bacterium]